MPRPSRSTLMMPMSAQSSLSHCTTLRPGIVAGSSGTTESSWPWQIDHAAGMLAEMPRQILNAHAQLEKFPDARMAHIEAGFAELRFERVGFVLVFPMADEARQPIQRRRIEAQHFADFARGGPAAIGDDIGGHGGAELAVALVDVLNGALALIAAGQIEIDVRPLAALFGKKSLEQQFHFHRIDGRDSQHITNGAVGGRAAALHENVVLQAELHDVPDDQEIAFQLEFLDQREFAFDLSPGFFVVRTEALARAFVGALAQKRSHRFAVADRIARELVAEIFQA